jgi:CBS domain-containing protein
MPERPVRSILGRRRLGPVLVSAGPDETAREAAVRMAETCRGNLLVVEDGRALGLFTERDLLERVVAAGRDPARTRLREVMRADFETIAAEAPVAEAVRRMDEGGLRHLPVSRAVASWGCSRAATSRSSSWAAWPGSCTRGTGWQRGPGK